MNLQTTLDLSTNKAHNGSMTKTKQNVSLTPETKQLAQTIAAQTTGGNVSVLIEMLIRKEARRLKVTLSDAPGEDIIDNSKKE